MTRSVFRFLTVLNLPPPAKQDSSLGDRVAQEPPGLLSQHQCLDKYKMCFLTPSSYFLPHPTSSNRFDRSVLQATFAKGQCTQFSSRSAPSSRLQQYTQRTLAALLTVRQKIWLTFHWVTTVMMGLLCSAAIPLPQLEGQVTSPASTTSVFPKI